jgi:hypothetical protein
MCKLSVEALQSHLSKPYHNIDSTLMDRLLRTILMVPMFTEKQKSILLECSGQRCPIGFESLLITFEDGPQEQYFPAGYATEMDPIGTPIWTENERSSTRFKISEREAEEHLIFEGLRTKLCGISVGPTFPAASPFLPVQQREQRNVGHRGLGYDFKQNQDYQNILIPAQKNGCFIPPAQSAFSISTLDPMGNRKTIREDSACLADAVPSRVCMTPDPLFRTSKPSENPVSVISMNPFTEMKDRTLQSLKPTDQFLNNAIPLIPIQMTKEPAGSGPVSLEESPLDPNVEALRTHLKLAQQRIEELEIRVLTYENGTQVAPAGNK